MMAIREVNGLANLLKVPHYSTKRGAIVGRVVMLTSLKLEHQQSRLEQARLVSITTLFKS